MDQPRKEKPMLPTQPPPVESTPATSSETGKKKRKKKKKKNKCKAVEHPETTDLEKPQPATEPTKKRIRKKNKGKADKADVWERKTNLVERLSNERLAAYGVNAKKLKNRVKYSQRYQAK